MTFEQGLALGLLALTLTGFVWGRFRYDVVAAFILLTLVLSGLTSPEHALAGFGHPAVITVAAVLIISRGLKNAGVIDVIGRHLAPLTRTEVGHIAGLSSVAAACSAFMNNVGALAVLMPVALDTARERKRSPSIILMPLSFAAILGGMVTLIGTPPNIIVALLHAETAGRPFRMFDFTPVGLPVAVTGVLFVSLIGWRLLPRDRRGTATTAELFEIEGYLTEVRVGAESPLVGLSFQEVEEELGPEATIAGRERANGKIVRPSRRERVRPDDMLVLRADPSELVALMERLQLSLVASENVPLSALQGDELRLSEAVVAPGSPLTGRDVSYLRRRSGYSLHPLAIARSGAAIRSRLREQKLMAGDVLLLQSDEGAPAEELSSLGLLPLRERGLRLAEGGRPLTALLIFSAAVLLAAFGLLPIAIAFVAAILAYVVLGILPVRELYDAVDWPIIVLLGALMPLGGALQSTGATQLIAGRIGSLGTLGLPAWVVLVLIMVATMCLSDVINNAATALVMAPIAAASATQLGASADAFYMAVAVGASCAFLTPIGHQCNTLVMGPSGYRFGDYWRMGLPLEVLVVAVATPLLLLFWPL